MSWHGIEAGQQIASDEVCRLCERHIRKGGVHDVKGKLCCVARIRNCGYTRIVFAPIAWKGWGASPMDPNAWRTTGGAPIT